MGVALVLFHVRHWEPVEKAKARLYKSVHFTVEAFNSFTLVKRPRALILKVEVAPMYNKLNTQAPGIKIGKYINLLSLYQTQSLFSVVCYMTGIHFAFVFNLLCICFQSFTFFVSIDKIISALVYTHTTSHYQLLAV